MNLSSAVPLVSVCIPVYNHAGFVAECIESVIAQTYPNIELIIIDDGSTDLSYEVVERYIESCKSRFCRFKVISRPNVGVSETLNEGLSWAEGEYFCGLASDDVIFPDKTKVLIEYLEKNPNAVAVFGSVFLIDEKSNTLGKRVASSVYNFEEIFLLRAELPAPAALIRLDALKEAGGFDKNTKVEDWDMWLKLSFGNNSAIAVVPNILAGYRMHSSNTWKQLDAMHSAKMKIIERYSCHKDYARARVAVECARFRDLSASRKVEALIVLRSIVRSLGVFKELRFYQGICYLFFRW